MACGNVTWRLTALTRFLPSSEPLDPARGPATARKRPGWARACRRARDRAATCGLGLTLLK